MIPKSPQPTLARKQLMKKRLKWVGIVSLVPVVFVVAVLCYLGIQESIAAGELKQKLTNIRQAGEPVDNESLARFFEGMSHKEGTEAWTEILDLSQAVNSSVNYTSKLPIVGQGELPSPLIPGSDWADEALVAEYLKEIRPVLKRLYQADSFPKPVWMPLAFDGIYTLLPQIQESRSLARFLELDAMHALYHKDSDRALKDIVAMRSVADAFDWRFCLVTNLVNLAHLGLQRNTIERSLAMNVWSEEQLSSLSEQVKQRYDVVDSWRQSFAGERAMAYSFLDNPAKRIAEMDNNPIARLPVLSSTRLALLAAYEELQHCAVAGEAGLLDRTKNVEQQLVSTRFQVSIQNIYLGLLMPGIQAYASAFDRLETGRRFTLTSIAIKQYQLKNKRWPKSLSELTEVGLMLEDWTTTNHQTFGYEVDGEMAYAWSADFSSMSVPKSRPKDLKADQVTVSVVSIR